MHEDDKNTFAATQSKGKTRRKQAESFLFFWISSLNDESPGHSLFSRSKTVSAYGSILPTFRNTDFYKSQKLNEGAKNVKGSKGNDMIGRLFVKLR